MRCIITFSDILPVCTEGLMEDQILNGYLKWKLINNKNKVKNKKFLK